MARQSKIPPTTRKLTFGNSSVRPNGIVDIAQCLSLLNRKAFRQGMEYYVESWSLSSEVPCQAFVMTIGQSWVNSNAWVKAFHTWMESQRQVDDFESIKGRYHDFKIFMNEPSAAAGTAANILPYDIDVADAIAAGTNVQYEWAASHIQIPNDGAPGVTNEYTMHMLGPDVPGSSKGIVQGYAESRSRPLSPDPNTTQNAFSWMDAAFDDGDNLFDIRSDLQGENDTPPYIIDVDSNFEFYPGGSNSYNGAGLGLDVSNLLQVNPALGTYLTKMGPGFVAPCGLVFIVATTDVDFQITLNLALGPYKGVLARPMQDVN